MAIFEHFEYNCELWHVEAAPLIGKTAVDLHNWSKQCRQGLLTGGEKTSMFPGTLLISADGGVRVGVDIQHPSTMPSIEIRTVVFHQSKAIY